MLNLKKEWKCRCI